MQPSTTTSSPLTTFQPVLPALTTILTHVDAQRTTQDQFQASSTDGTLTDDQETALHAYDDKISKQALQVRRSLLDQAKTAYTPHSIPGSQFSIDEMALMEKVLDEKMQQRRALLEQFSGMVLPVSRSMRG